MAIIGQDTFQRADQSGWGTASDGQIWVQLGGTETLAIAGNAATATGNINTDNWFALGTNQQADTDITASFSFTNQNNDVPGIMLRWQGNNTAYRIRNNGGTLGVRRLNAGAVTTIGTDVAFALSNGVKYFLRGQIIGATIRAKMWKSGDAEPDKWNYLATDPSPISGPGRFGLYGVINTTATDVNTYYSFLATDAVTSAPRPRYITRGFLSTIVPDPVTQPLPYIERGMLSTIIYENRTFVPRALGGVYIPDTALWVPRGLGGTLTLPLATATTSSFVEALTANDSASTFVQVALPVDALSASETLLATDGDVPLDSLTASEIGGLFGWPVDALTALDSLLVVATDIPLDGLAASASLLGADGSLYTEATSASATAQASDGGLFTEANAASDALSGGNANGLVESLSTADGTLDLDAYAALDGLSADDSASTMSQSSPSLVTTTYSFTEALAASDSLQSVDTALSTEASSASDSQSGGASSSFSEGLAVGDALAALEGYAPFDLLVASDVGGMTRGFVEALSLSDSFVQADSYQPAAVQSVTESLLAGERASWVDLLTALDALAAQNLSPQPPQYLTATWVTRDLLANWTTRDLPVVLEALRILGSTLILASAAGHAITWTTRDGKVTWTTRDEQAGWDARDELATWKTRR